MASTGSLAVKDLSLDLSNFRTVRQVSEEQAVQAMISISPDRFWALMESLIEDGYLPTENILVLKSEGVKSELIVKEGNRRIAALKLIYQLIPIDTVSLPDHIKRDIAGISEGWRRSNQEVPCALYEAKDAAIVDKIITLAHGKGEKAGRDQWNAVARARHNRDVNNISEPGLDLLEKYLEMGKTRTQQQAERWAGDYPLTVLEEAMKRLAPKLELPSASALAKSYPNIQQRDALEGILRDIGLEVVGFKTIRGNDDFAAKYGLVNKASSEASHGTESQKGSGDGVSSRGNSGSDEKPNGKKDAQANQSAKARKTASVALDDPKAVRRKLRKFIPRGDSREKVVTLRNEALNLDLSKNPLAFCFILRSMFEISAKAYCEDYKDSGGPPCTKSDGKERMLVEVLRDIVAHLTKGAGGKPDLASQKVLHGAMTELGRPEGILSVTSMNQLIHNPLFSVTENDVSTMFGNVFPLLQEMNK